MKINLVLNKDNLLGSSEGDDYIFENEIIIYTTNIHQLSREEIKRIRKEVFGIMDQSDTTKRNGINYINDKGFHTININIFNYPLKKDWTLDDDILKLRNDIEEYFSKMNESNENKEEFMINTENPIFIELTTGDGGIPDGVASFEYTEKILKVLDENKIEYQLLYEEITYDNVGASFESVRIFFEFLGGIDATFSFIEFFKNAFGKKSPEIRDFNTSILKQKISDKYEIAENQIEFVGNEYNKNDRRLTYEFETRDKKYYITIDSENIPEFNCEIKTN